MPVTYVEGVGRSTLLKIAGFGDFAIFVGRTFHFLTAMFRWKNLRLLLPQMYEVGVKSVPVVAVTGAFIGMVLAIETHTQFKSIGQENRLGSIINISVVKQIGPVLASGDAGGANRRRAHCGTGYDECHRAARRAARHGDGSDPISCCPAVSCLRTADTDIDDLFRFSWCGRGMDDLGAASGRAQRTLLAILRDRGGQLADLRRHLQIRVLWREHRAHQLLQGIHVWRRRQWRRTACTEAFVASFIAIIVQNFFFAEILKQWYIALFGIRSVFG